MRKFLTLTLLFCGVFFSSFLHSTELLFNQSDFSKGINTNDLPDKIQDNQVVEAMNMWFNKNSGVTRRDGFGLKVTTRAVQAVNSWTYTDTVGNEWLLVLYADGTLIAGKSLGLLGNNFSIVVSSQFSLSQPTDADIGLGKIWFSNKQDGLSWWDGVNFASSTIAPKAGSIRIWRNRVCLGDISNELSSVRFSGELNGEDWTNNSRFSTSPVSIRIGGVNDGARVFGISVGMDELIVFKKKAMYGIGGNDQRDFYVRQISDSVGTIYPKTAKQYFNTTIFLSNRGLDSYTPSNSFNFIGNGVKNQLDPLSILGSFARYQTVTRQVDFGEGVSVPPNNISSNVVNGDLFNLVLATGDTTSDDFGANTLDISPPVQSPSYNYQTTYSTAVDNSIIYTSSAVVKGILNGSVETADPILGVNYPLLWTTNPPTMFRDNTTASLGTWSLKIDKGSAFNAGDCIRLDLELGESGSYSTIDSSCPSITDQPFSKWTTAAIGSSFINQRLYGRLRIVIPTVSGAEAKTHSYYVAFGTTASMDIRCVGTNVRYIDNFYTPISTDNFPSHVMLSRTFDQGIYKTSYTNVQLVSSFTVVNGSVTFTVSNSTDNLTWSNSYLVSSGAILNIDNRYIKYVASITAVSQNNTTVPVRIQIDNIQFNNYTTGYYQLLMNPGGNVTSWGLFSAVTNGSITFRVQSSSDTVLEENQWVSQVNNSTIAQPAYPYLGVRAIFYTAFATNPASIQEFTINWNEGEAPPIPLAATNQDNYFLFFSTTTGSTSINDSLIIYEQNDSLTNFNNIYAGGVVEYSNKLTIADAQPSGNIYVLETSTDGTDNLLKVPSYVKLKRIGSMVDKKKDWEYFFFTLSRKDVSQSQIFKVSYYVDGDTTTWFTDNVELSTGSYAGNFRSNVPGDNQRESQFIDLKIEDLTQSYPYSIHGVRGYGTLVDIR